MKEAIRMYREGEYENALARLLDLRVETDEYPELSYYLGLCYTHLGRFDEAVLYLEQVVTADLGFAQMYQARMVLGYIYAVTKRYRLAEFEFGKLLEEGYESAKVHSALAHVRYCQGDPEDAIDHLEHALTIEPANANAMNSLGYVLADQGLRLGRALNYCKQAVSHSPENAAYIDSLAWCYYRSGRRKEATELLRRASRLAPKAEEIQEHLRLAEGG